jgi:hypothetical protein
MSAISGLEGLPKVSPRRRRTDQIMRGVLATLTGIALIPLALVI